MRATLPDERPVVAVADSNEAFFGVGTVLAEDEPGPHIRVCVEGFVEISAGWEIGKLESFVGVQRQCPFGAVPRGRSQCEVSSSGEIVAPRKGFDNELVA